MPTIKERDTMNGPAELAKIIAVFAILAVLNPDCSKLPQNFGYEAGDWSFIWWIIAAFVIAGVSGQMKFNKRKKDQAQFNSYKQLAEQGDANAQYNLGVCFENGMHVTKDMTQAINWYRKAAERGNVDAECKLGQLFCYSVIKDNVEIVDWVRRAAELGYAKAQCSMGIYYYYGHGVTKDRAQAVSWYHKAAEQGYVLAQYNLGNIYKNGKNEIKKDGNIALYWYEKAISDEKRNLPKNLIISAKKSIKKLEAAGYSSSRANI